MRVWRICLRRHARAAFTGEGARRFGARWNPPGLAVVYASGSLALAALEMLARLEPSQLPHKLVAISAEIPSSLRVSLLDLAELPKSWRETPPPAALQRIGADCVKGAKTAVLVLPSVIIPYENNYLINPAHPDARKIDVTQPETFLFDPRLWKP